MRNPKHLFCVVLVCLLLSACPLLPGVPWPPAWWPPLLPGGNGNNGSLEFLSADVNGSGRGGEDFASGAEGEGESEAPTVDGGTPREVTEPDVIRRAGNLLYILNQHRGLSIVNLDTEVLLTQVPTVGFPRDLYLVGDRAYILVGNAQQFLAEDSLVGFDISSRLYVVDVSDPASANVVSQFDLEGDLVDSRLVGDVLYAVGAQYEWYYWEDGVGGVVDGEAGPEVFKQQTSGSWVTSVSLSDPQDIHVVDSLGFGDIGSVIQATPSAIFVASTNWGAERTAIQYVDISDPTGVIAVRDSIGVPGYVADRFKMDVFNGVLRVVSNTFWPERDVYVTTVDLADPDDLVQLGSTIIPNASGETLFATRFDGDRAYVVTYFLVDPLFVLDLSDPANPRVAGELTVPGWSVHIEPQGDRLIALGVDDQNGRRVKVSLFDVANPEDPKELDVASFGDNWAWSNAFSDVKSFTVLDDTLIVPFAGWSGEAGGYQRLQFLSYTRDTLDLRGSVDVEGNVLRSFAYEGLYYGVTTEQVAIIDASDMDAPEVVRTISLAEYVVDYFELSADMHVEVVAHYDRGVTLLRTLTPEGALLGEVEIDMPYVASVHPAGNKVALVANEWNERSYYRVAIVDCAAPETPLLREVQVDVDPYWGGYGYYDDIAVSVESRPGLKQADRIWGYPWYGGATAYVAEGQLALRCSKAEYDTVFGSGTPNEGIALVDLDTATWTQTIGFTYSQIVAINESGGKLYLSTKRDVGRDRAFRPVCAFFVQKLDLLTPASGPVANVPGQFLQYDAQSGILVLEDVQYSAGWTIKRRLNSVKWNGLDSVESIDSLELPENAGQAMPRGARIYIEYYQEGYTLGSVSVSASGDLSHSESINAANQWAYLLGAHASAAYVVVGGNAIARYDFSGSPVLTDLVQFMGWPSTMRFGLDTAYAPVGYSGVVRLPL